MKLNANEIKLIALIAMIVDHIGVYFYTIMQYDTYSACRIIGRIAMPIFVYFIVQGFFKTSNLKKYILRILLLAISAEALSKIAYNIYPREDLTYLLNTCNIVFNFFIILVTLRIIDRELIRSKSENKYYQLFIKALDKIVRTSIILLFVILYFYIKLDYDIPLLAMAICIYLFQKAIYSKKYNKKIENILKILLLISMYMFCIIEKINYGIFTIFALPILFAYNGEIGRKTKFSKYAFYIVFAFQGVFLYILSSIFIK